MNPWDVVRCVVFDFDGTLVESNPIKRGAYFDVVADVPGGAEIAEQVLASRPGADRTGILAGVREALASRSEAPLPPLEDWVDAYSRLCEERVAACPALPGAVAALQALRETHALYLDSATPTDALEAVVRRRGWQDWFRGVLGGPASKHENLESIAKREGTAPGEMLYIGDGRADLDAARSFGCAFLGFESPAGDLAESDALAVLASLVDEIAGR